MPLLLLDENNISDAECLNAKRHTAERNTVDDASTSEKPTLELNLSANKINVTREKFLEEEQKQ